MVEGESEGDEADWDWDASLRLAFHCNVTLSEYEEMTPHELNVLSDVMRQKAEAEFENKVTIAWLAEMYHRQDKLPPLKDCLEDLKPKEVVNGAIGGMTDDEMLAMAKSLNKQFGGTTEG